MYMSYVTFDNASFRDQTDLQRTVEAKKVTLIVQYRNNFYKIYVQCQIYISKGELISNLWSANFSQKMNGRICFYTD